MIRNLNQKRRGAPSSGWQASDVRQKMNSIFHALILFLFTLTCRGDDEWESDYPLIAGHYEVIGRRCESGKLFAGTITIKEATQNVFIVTRTIDGKAIVGSGKVGFATPDKIPVFRIRFVENGLDMEGTFIWRGDLDNDGRVSGYVFNKGHQGKRPGVEALFAKKNQAEQDVAPDGE